MEPTPDTRVLLTEDAYENEERRADRRFIRHAPEHVHRCGPNVMVLTPEGADVFALLFTHPVARQS